MMNCLRDCGRPRSRGAQGLHLPRTGQSSNSKSGGQLVRTPRVKKEGERLRRKTIPQNKVNAVTHASGPMRIETVSMP